MLIAIDRSFGQFDRALIGLATNFRGAFRSRAGGFKAPMVSTFAWAIALTIVGRCDGHGRPNGHVAFFASGGGQCGMLTVSVKVLVCTNTTSLKG